MNYESDPERLDELDIAHREAALDALTGEDVDMDRVIEGTWERAIAAGLIEPERLPVLRQHESLDELAEFPVQGDMGDVVDLYGGRSLASRHVAVGVNERVLKAHKHAGKHRKPARTASAAEYGSRPHGMMQISYLLLDEVIYRAPARPWSTTLKTVVMLLAMTFVLVSSLAAIGVTAHYVFGEMAAQVAIALMATAVVINSMPIFMVLQQRRRRGKKTRR
jgi:hypothetical protein